MSISRYPFGILRGMESFQEWGFLSCFKTFIKKNFQRKNRFKIFPAGGKKLLKNV